MRISDWSSDVCSSDLRKPGPRTLISAKLVANLITTSGADRVLAIDLHAGQIQGFFDIPTDNLYAAPVMSTDIQARFGGKNLMVVSPNVGGVVRARALAPRLANAPSTITAQRRVWKWGRHQFRSRW